MKFTFTGTGTSQGVPVVTCRCEVCRSDDPRDKRLRTSGYLESAQTSLVFDTGPDFRQQMLRIEAKDLDAVVFTHQHKDHTAGLDDVRAFNFMLKKDMHIYANDLTIEHLKKEYYYIFERGDYPGLPQLQIHEIGMEPFRVGDIDLQPMQVMHHELPVMAYRINDFAYVTDANYISPETMAQLQGLDVLVLNALRREKHRSHYTLQEALEIVEILGPKRAYFTHISHLLGRHSEVSKELPAHVSLAYDGLVIENI